MGANLQETIGEKFDANNAILSEEVFMRRMFPENGATLCRVEPSDHRKRKRVSPNITCTNSESLIVEPLPGYPGYLLFSNQTTDLVQDTKEIK